MSRDHTGAPSKSYAGFDVSPRTTAICILDDTGRIAFEGSVPSDPASIARCLAKHGGDVDRIGIESGMTS